MYKTSNPALTSKTFDRAQARETGDVMTLEGVIHKSALLLLLCIATASFTWSAYFQGDQRTVSLGITVGLFGGLITALVTAFKPRFAPFTAPLYALLEGLALGGISATYEALYQGLPLQAVLLTFATFAALLLAYRSGLIRASENFRLGITAATLGIALFYLVSFVLSFFGVSVPLLHSNGWMGIGFSLFIVGIAALNFVLDFDFVERGVETRASKYMEWYAGFGLLVTAIWLYLEILRLLAKTQSRR